MLLAGYGRIRGSRIVCGLLKSATRATVLVIREELWLHKAVHLV